MMKRYEETFSALMSLITFSMAPSPYRFDSVLPPFFPPLPIVCQLTKPKNTTKREKFMDLCDGDSAVGVGGGDKNLGKSDIILGLIVTKGLFEEFINK
jgi:hypothetical protein